MRLSAVLNMSDSYSGGKKPIINGNFHFSDNAYLKAKVNLNAIFKSFIIFVLAMQHNFN